MTTPEDAVVVLNRINEADPSVLAALIRYRVPCNEAVADDPTVQVIQYPEDEIPTVGLLGILNGIFGIREDGKGWIAAWRDKQGNYTNFMLTPEDCDCVGAKPKEPK